MIGQMTKICLFYVFFGILTFWLICRVMVNSEKSEERAKAYVKEHPIFKKQIFIARIISTFIMIISLFLVYTIIPADAIACIFFIISCISSIALVYLSIIWIGIRKYEKESYGES